MRKLFTTIILLVLLTPLVGSTTGCKPTEDAESAGGTGITSEATSPAQMKVGDILSFEVGAADAKIDFADIDPASSYILVAGTSDLTDSSEFKITPATSKPATEAALTPKTIMPQVDIYDEPLDPKLWLRVAERELSKNIEPQPQRHDAGKSMGMKAAVVAGSPGSFKVLKNLASPCGDVATVQSTATHIGQSLIFFVEDGLTVDTEILKDIDEKATWIIGQLGPPSDVNGDGHVAVNINRQMPQSWTTSALGGYSYGNDPTPYQDCEHTSNHREVIHINHAIHATHQFADTIIHELQHQINYTRRILSNGAPAEKIWVDEALSHLLEDRIGNGGHNTVWLSAFLSNPTSSLTKDGSMTSAERGAAYLFLRYLYGQATDKTAFLRKLIDSPHTGNKNVVTSFNEASQQTKKFSELLAQWMIAVAASGHEISISPEFNFASAVPEESQTQTESSVSKTIFTVGKVKSLPLDNMQQFTLEPSSAKYFSVDPSSGALTVNAKHPSSFALLIRIQ